MTRTVGRSFPITAAIVMIVAGVTGSSPAAAVPPLDARVETAADPDAGCRAPVPSPVRADYVIADPNCDFGTNLPFRSLLAADGTPVSDVYTGIDAGAAWRVEIPKRWNGDLVLYTHGDHPTNDVVYVDSPPGTRESFVAKGYAWVRESRSGLADRRLERSDLAGTVGGHRANGRTDQVPPRKLGRSGLRWVGLK
jgi:hypothetical protein